jgi:hypothetical protein
VNGLAGHLVRAGARIGVYLDQESPAGEPIPAPTYFASLLQEMDDSENERIRKDGETTSAAGWEALIEEHRRLGDDLKRRLAKEPPERKVKVFAGKVMLLDNYLETRIVELLVHTDDLAVSVGVTPPEIPESAADIAIGHLVEVGRSLHGNRAVLMALSRRERDEVRALRIF